MRDNLTNGATTREKEEEEEEEEEEGALSTAKGPTHMRVGRVQVRGLLVGAPSAVKRVGH